MSSRQDAVDERLSSLEDKFQGLQVGCQPERIQNVSVVGKVREIFPRCFSSMAAQVNYCLIDGAFERRLLHTGNLHLFFQDQLEALPELITRCLTQHQERVDQRRNFLHPDTASSILPTPSIGVSMGPSIGSPLLIPHSR